MPKKKKNKKNKKRNKKGNKNQIAINDDQNDNQSIATPSVTSPIMTARQIKISTMIKNCKKSWTKKTGLTPAKYKKKNKFWEANQVISNFLWIGSIASATCYYQLKQLNIKYVLNCAEPLLNPKYKQNGIEYLCLNAQDAAGYDMVAHLDIAIKFIEQAKINQQQILIHCMGGVNRSGCIMVGYLLYRQLKDSPKHINLITALQMVLVKRPFILTNESFQKQLIDYEQYLTSEANKQYKNDKNNKNGKKNRNKNKKKYNKNYNQQLNDEQKVD